MEINRKSFYWSNGSDQLDIYLAISSTLLGYNLFLSRGSPIDFIPQFICLVLPIIISYSTTTPYYTLAFLILLYTASLYKPSIREPSTVMKEDSSLKLNYITLFRGFLQLLTIVAILAVDFKVFPRKFAKTHDFGFSLVRYKTITSTSTYLSSFDLYFSFF